MKTSIAIFLASVTLLSACGEKAPEAKKINNTEVNKVEEGKIFGKSPKGYYSKFYFWDQSDCQLDIMPIHYIITENNVVRSESDTEPGLVFDFYIMMSPYGDFMYSYTEREIRVNADGIEESREVFNDRGEEGYEILDSGDIRFGRWGQGRGASYRYDQINFFFNGGERSIPAGFSTILRLVRSTEASIDPEYKKLICK